MSLWERCFAACITTSNVTLIVLLGWLTPHDRAGKKVFVCKGREAFFSILTYCTVNWIIPTITITLKSVESGQRHRYDVSVDHNSCMTRWDSLFTRICFLAYFPQLPNLFRTRNMRTTHCNSVSLIYTREFIQFTCTCRQTTKNVVHPSLFYSLFGISSLP